MVCSLQRGNRFWDGTTQAGLVLECLILCSAALHKLPLCVSTAPNIYSPHCSHLLPCRWAGMLRPLSLHRLLPDRASIDHINTWALWSNHKDGGRLSLWKICYFSLHLIWKEKELQAIFSSTKKNVFAVEVKWLQGFLDPSVCLPISIIYSYFQSLMFSFLANWETVPLRRFHAGVCVYL